MRIVCDVSRLVLFHDTDVIDVFSPVEDSRALFEILDIGKVGKIECSTFCDMFQDEVYAKAAQMGTVDLDEIIKDKLTHFLSDSRIQRSHIIQAFMAASRTIEQDDKGFGKSFWGNKWKHFIFDNFYTNANNPTNLPMKTPKVTVEQRKNRRGSLRMHRRQSTWFEELGGDNRYELLKQHLRLAAEGKHEGLREAVMSGQSEGAFGDITDPSVVPDFCRIWLCRLRDLERNSSEDA